MTSGISAGTAPAHSAATGRLRTALEIFAGGIIVLIPALLNGYPFIYPDTGTYILQAVERVGAPDRPPYYSLLILPLHATVSLWPVALAQCCAVGGSVRLASWVVGADLRGLGYFAVLGALTALSTLPFHAGQLVPDLFASLLPLWILPLVYAWDRLGGAQRTLLVVATAGAAATHQSHLPLAAAIFAAAAGARLLQGFGLRDFRRVVGLGAVVVGLATAGLLTYSLAIVGRFTLSPQGSVFLLARLVADGPAVEYLAETCPGSGNPFCGERDRMDGDHSDFLWDPDGPVARLNLRLGMEQTRRAAAEVVSGTLATRPREVALAMAGNVLRTAASFGALDTCPPGCIVGSTVDVTIQKYFPSEYPHMRGSLQMRGLWPIHAIRVLDGAALLLSVFAAGFTLARAAQRGDSPLLGLGALVVATLLANAVVMGALAGPYDRFQSRVIWLVPLTALLGVARWRRCAE
ncbi:MAG TPA: hypothetical protein VMR50_11780 [Myxococcota bacterium]|nr:hypothetical protein [Myxococcota bacterium]